MKHTMLVNAVHKEQMRMATVNEKGILVDFNIEMPTKEPITGNIYKGKVLKVERGLQAAFVDYGGSKDGFLPLKDVNPEYFTEQGNGQSNGKPILKVGQEIIVQAVREAIGNKGALLSSYISLPGRYLVLLPNKPGSGISRKVEDEEDRQKIKNIMKQIKIPEHMGFIVRTAGYNRTKQEMSRDYQHLVRLWKEINRKAGSLNKTSLIYQETDFGVRSLRDYLTSEVDEILVDDLETFRKMRAYLRAISPRNIKMLKHYKEKTPLFDNYKLEDQIRVIYQERVDLKSGGHIVINPTEAMITIDVNSGRASNKKNIEETAFKTNIEASEEIARQLRLRDLGGLIVIDFIDMTDKKHIAEVEKAFKTALSIDKARIQLSRISKFGILELSRQKKQSTIQEISYTKCPFCKGSGLRQSLEAAALGAFRKIESEAVKGICSELKIILPHEIADYILNRKRSELLDLELEFDIALNIAGSAEIPWDKVVIQQIAKNHVDDQDNTEEIKDAETQEASRALIEEKVSVNGEKRTKKKNRRRPRHKKRKPMEASTETSLAMNGVPEIVQEVQGEDNLPAANTPAKSSPFIIEPARPEKDNVNSRPDEQKNNISEPETNRKDEE
ncbi:MAG: ribonuclease [Smithella sp. SDB]|nr:MAG: ribonuclease [Smithella sp. SDB]